MEVRVVSPGLPLTSSRPHGHQRHVTTGERPRFDEIDATGDALLKHEDGFAECSSLSALQQNTDLGSSRKTSIELCAGVVEDIVGRVKIASYFVLWYALNVIYNIVNKKVLNVLPTPITLGSLQLGVGALYATILWALSVRSAPNLTPEGKRIVRNIGTFHAIGQILTVCSLGSGTVGFTHIVKATEPFFSAVISALVVGKWMKLQVYMTLVPVVGGVSYACLNDRGFSLLALFTALGSNIAFALRAVTSKSAMTKSVGDNISSANLFAVVTIESFFLSVPMVLVGEGLTFLAHWSRAVGKGSDVTALGLAGNIIFSGLFHYLNNEVMYLALAKVHPVTLAVGNTMKRVVILLASVLFFHDPISLQAGIGTSVGMAGVLLYSLTKQYYEGLEAETKCDSS